MTAPALRPRAPTEASAPRPETSQAAAAPVASAAPPALTSAGRRKLDLSRVAPPENLESVRVEELTIDGICGVY